MQNGLPQESNSTLNALCQIKVGQALLDKNFPLRFCPLTLAESWIIRGVGDGHPPYDFAPSPLPSPVGRGNTPAAFL